MTLKQKHFFITSGLLAAFLGLNFIMPSFAFAFSGGQPFGARILTTNMPVNITCSDYGPATVETVGTASSGVHWSFAPAGEVAFGGVAPSAWVLGFYAQSSTCLEQYGPYQIPYTTTYSSFYGTSF